MRTVYLNGRFIPENEAKISIFDRGFLMSDGVYEVTSVVNRKLIDFAGHYSRLQRSLSELEMATPMNHDALLSAHRTIIDKNNVNQGLIYLQITRGSAGDRDFIFPDPETTPQTVVMFSQNKKNLVDNPSAVSGIKVISIEDQRWGRRDIKTTQLLYPSIGKMMAQKLNADDAWMVEDGYVTEGTSNNAYIINDGKIITRAKSYAILHGITRSAIIRFAEEAEMEIEERNFSINEAINADEAFITSASSFVTPVVNIDGQNVSNGSPGPMTQRLRQIYLDESIKTAI